MNKALKQIFSKYSYKSSLGIVTILVLFTVFVPPIEVLSGEMESQWKWFSYTGFLFTIITILLVCSNIKIKFNFKDIVTWGLIITGGIEALWGLGQLYDLSPSNHTLFSITGTFPNPGPFSGYLALVFPLCLYEYLNLKKEISKSLLDKIKYSIVLFIILLILCILPAGMSRSAWVATLVSSLFIYGYQYSWISKLAIGYKQNKKRVIGILSICIIVLILACISIFQIKKDSAHGRLFMWKISYLAIKEKPFSGYGTNSFPLAYGKAQEAYFSKGNYAEWEEYVAGSPEYAFNEYLQIAIEWGIPVLSCILLTISLCIWKGLKKKYIGICGSIISILIFGIASYPLQLPAFIITTTFLLAVCIIGESKIRLLIFALIVGGTSIYWYKMNLTEECNSWISCHILYRSGSYQKAVKKYEALYPKLKNKAFFMYEYGHTLHKLNLYKASTEKLEEAAKLSCDPMILNIIGLNYQNEGEYSKAENIFIRSTHLLPGRIYPYYLLTKLYANPFFFHIDKMKYMSNIVLNKKPKVQTKKIDIMRKEVQEIINRVITLHPNE